MEHAGMVQSGCRINPGRHDTGIAKRGNHQQADLHMERSSKRKLVLPVGKRQHGECNQKMVPPR